MVKRQGSALYVSVLFIVALAIRGFIAFNSGIWADEGSFLAVVAAPSWRAMIDFLRLHESHPPLFYALMRLWMSATGGSDFASLLLPIMIGAAIVPAVYLAGASLFSRRTGLLAATLATVSPALAEHSAQLRPYGLLPLLVLASSWSMIVAVRRRDIRSWAAYIAATVLLLYTHNWGWIVASAEQLAAIIAVAAMPRDAKQSVTVQWLTSWGVILTAYLPWISILIYQEIHAGHSAVALHDPAATLGFVIFGFLTALQTFFLGIPGGSNAFVSGLIVALVTAAVALYQLQHQPAHPAGIHPLPHGIGNPKNAALTLLTVIVASCAIAMILSPRSNLMLPRCLTALVPLVLIVVSSWCVNLWVARASKPITAVLATALVGFLVGQAAWEVRVLTRTPRSNAREVALSIKRQLLATDLLILAPEWYSASFNHYFGDPVDQVDYPHAGRITMTDFTDTWKRASDTVALVTLIRRITLARRDARRIWLVSEREYLKSPDAAEIAFAEKYMKPATLWRARIARIRAALDAEYGAPRAVTSGVPRSPRYDDMRAWVYSPINLHMTTSR
jgi:4-amino-4-deoxy-L-arabinose transferase-like glycosyltransferase